MNPTTSLTVKPMVEEPKYDKMNEFISNFSRMTSLLTDGNLPTISIEDILHEESFSDDFDIIEADFDFNDDELSEQSRVLQLVKKAIDADEFVLCNTCDAISPVRGMYCLNCRGDDFCTQYHLEDNVKNTLPTDDQSFLDRELEAIEDIKLLTKYLIDGE